MDQHKLSFRLLNKQPAENVMSVSMLQFNTKKKDTPTDIFDPFCVKSNPEKLLVNLRVCGEPSRRRGTIKNILIRTHAYKVGMTSAGGRISG